MFHQIQSKVYIKEELLDVMANWRANGESVVFTNGCFDLIHAGHLQYLAEARTLGDKLIVGLNSDESVKLLKGDSRPIKDENTRALLLASMHMVDAVILFSEETPLNLISDLLPDVLVKGGDWPVDKIVGAEVVLKNGGEVKSLGFIPGQSSSNLIQKIREEENQ